MRLESRLLKALDEICLESARSRSDVVRDALRRYLVLARFEVLRRQVMPVPRRGVFDRRGRRSRRVVRVFLDTNVLVNAFATRGLAADVFRVVLVEHELTTAEVNLRELERLLRTRSRVPAEAVGRLESLLREATFVPVPENPAPIPIRDADDAWVPASALDGGAEVLVTGDRDLLDLGESAPLPIVGPRGFWEMVSRHRRGWLRRSRPRMPSDIREVTQRAPVSTSHTR